MKIVMRRLEDDSRKKKKKKKKKTNELKASVEEFDDEDECNYLFVVNRWFAKNEDDGQIVRELVPTDASGNRVRSGSLPGMWINELGSCDSTGVRGKLFATDHVVIYFHCVAINFVTLAKNISANFPKICRRLYLLDLSAQPIGQVENL